MLRAWCLVGTLLFAASCHFAGRRQGSVSRQTSDAPSSKATELESRIVDGFGLENLPKDQEYVIIDRYIFTKLAEDEGLMLQAFTKFTHPYPRVARMFTELRVQTHGLGNAVDGAAGLLNFSYMVASLGNLVMPTRVSEALRFNLLFKTAESHPNEWSLLYPQLAMMIPDYMAPKLGYAMRLGLDVALAARHFGYLGGVIQPIAWPMIITRIIHDFKLGQFASKAVIAFSDTGGETLMIKWLNYLEANEPENFAKHMKLFEEAETLLARKDLDPESEMQVRQSITAALHQDLVMMLQHPRYKSFRDTAGADPIQRVDRMILADEKQKIFLEGKGIGKTVSAPPKKPK